MNERSGRVPMMWALRCRLPAQTAWTVAEALESGGAQSVTVIPLDAAAARYEPVPGATPLAGEAWVEALYDCRARAMAGARRIGEADSWRIEVRPERDWTAMRRGRFVPRHYGKRLWIVPEGREPPRPEAINVVIAPGLAFGTGEHPSTALCLEWLEGADVAGKTVVDYGCGSGILAVAALKLGAARAFAVDTEPQALLATRANAARNEVAVAASPPEALAASDADLLVANILARPLVALADEFCARVRAEGRLVLAGITAEQADVVAAAYLPRAHPAARTQRAQWVCLELVRALD